MTYFKFIGSLVLLLFLASCSKEVALSFANPIDEDIYQFANTLENKHADLFHQYSKSEFETAIQKMRAQSHQLSEADMIIGLMKILSRVGDSHTNLTIWPYVNSYPLQIAILSDGVWITGVDPNNEIALGQEIITMNELPIAQVMDSLKTVIAFENESTFNFFAANLINVVEVLKAFKITQENEDLKIGLGDGTSVSLPIQHNGVVSIFDQISTPLYLSNRDDYYWHQIIDEEDLLYIQYNKAQEQSILSFKNFTNQVEDAVADKPSLKKVVFDLRLNTGGNSAIAKPLIKLLESYVKSGKFKASDIYILIGRRTYSSGLLNAWELHELIDPILVGEPTGGKPNHFGEIRNFKLPNSGITVWHSTRFFELDRNAEESLYPDVSILLNSTGLFQGKDPLLEYIFEQ